MSRATSFLSRLVRPVVDTLPPGTRRKIKELLGRPYPRLVGLDELDRELEVAARLFSSDQDRARRLLEGFELDLPGERPDDPFSKQYVEWTWDLYRLISGRAKYTTANEASPFDLDRAVKTPFPFETGSASVVGDDLVARGRVMRYMGTGRCGLVPPARIVEFGPGWGNLTIDVASTGFDVTAVEVDERFCSLIEERRRAHTNLNVVHEDMLEFEADEPYDAAIFFESFHHCSNHLAMLRNLHQIVRRGGPILFASEPVQKMAYPWGPRLDGLSLWSTRTYGWLELGFDSRYFFRALAATGWRAERLRLGTSTRRDDVIVAVDDRS